MFSSHNGRVLYVSRPSLADVVAINLRTKAIIWRTKVDGNRADHMAISPDGTHLLVSASTAKVIDVIDTKTGAIVAKVPSGDQPHENNFSKDGKLVFHASIGTVFTPTDEPAFDATKGERVFEIIDTSNWQVIRKIDMGKKLDEFGQPDMSGAVRPMALAPDERYVYFQVSFFHGFVEYDLQQDRVLRLANLPVSDEAKQKRRDEYLLDSAHHGLAMNPSGTKLCAAGTMSDYAAIVDRSLVRVQDRGPGPQALLGHEQRPRQLLLRVVQRRRRRLGDLLPQGQGDRAHPGGRPPAADADGQGPRGAAGHEEAAPRAPPTLSRLRVKRSASVGSADGARVRAGDGGGSGAAAERRACCGRADCPAAGGRGGRCANRARSPRGDRRGLWPERGAAVAARGRKTRERDVREGTRSGRR